MKPFLNEMIICGAHTECYQHCGEAWRVDLNADTCGRACNRDEGSSASDPDANDRTFRAKNSPRGGGPFLRFRGDYVPGGSGGLQQRRQFSLNLQQSRQAAFNEVFDRYTRFVHADVHRRDDIATEIA